MEFNSFAEFIAMGRHGLYVWLAYGLTSLIVIYNLVQPILRRRSILKTERQRLRRETREKTPV